MVPPPTPPPPPPSPEMTHIFTASHTPANAIHHQCSTIAQSLRWTEPPPPRVLFLSAICASATGAHVLHVLHRACIVFCQIARSRILEWQQHKPARDCRKPTALHAPHVRNARDRAHLHTTHRHNVHLFICSRQSPSWRRRRWGDRVRFVSPPRCRFAPAVDRLV